MLYVLHVSLILTKLIYILSNCCHSWGHGIPWKKKMVYWDYLAFFSVCISILYIFLDQPGRNICTDKTKMAKIAFVVWKNLATFGYCEHLQKQNNLFSQKLCIILFLSDKNTLFRLFCNKEGV